MLMQSLGSYCSRTSTSLSSLIDTSNRETMQVFKVLPILSMVLVEFFPRFLLTKARSLSQSPREGGSPRMLKSVADLCLGGLGHPGAGT